MLMRGCEGVDESGLEAIRVLILVDEDCSKSTLISGGNLRIGQEEFVGLGEQVIKVESVHLFLATFVGGGHLCDLILQVDEVAVTSCQQGSQGLSCVAPEADQFGQDLSFGKAFVIGAESEACHHGFEEFLLILAVHDGESFRKSNRLRMTPQDPVSDRVEGSAPKSIRCSGEEGIDPLQHLAGRFVRKGQEEDFPWTVSLLQEPPDPVGEGAGFSTASTCDDQVCSGG